MSEGGVNPSALGIQDPKMALKRRFLDRLDNFAPPANKVSFLLASGGSQLATDDIYTVYNTPRANNVGAFTYHKVAQPHYKLNQVMNKKYVKKLTTVTYLHYFIALHTSLTLALVR